jgi:L-Ala-D/L-Glu epimerase
MLSIATETFPLAAVFTIARGSRTETEVVTVSISRTRQTGRGECVPYDRYGESIEGVMDQIKSLPEDVSLTNLPHLLPPGAARNAVDCALWDLAAKQQGKRVWQLAKLPPPVAVLSAYTLSLDRLEVMEEAARHNAWRPLLKIKLGTPEDMPRLEAVRRGAPQARLIIDANEGWTTEIYAELAPHLVRLGVEMVEQPLPAGEDDLLAEIPRPVPVCADESCHDRASLRGLAGKYDMINIKLDKTGGLTEALALRSAARAAGLQVMVGCMVGSSLGMAPAVLVAQGADLVDLDGPLLLKKDRPHPLRYDEQGVHPSDSALWG